MQYKSAPASSRIFASLSAYIEPDAPLMPRTARRFVSFFFHFPKIESERELAGNPKESEPPGGHVYIEKYGVYEGVAPKDYGANSQNVQHGNYCGAQEVANSQAE